MYFCCHGPMASADNVEFYIKTSPGRQLQQCPSLSSSPNLSFPSLHCRVICLPSSQIIVSGFVLTCYAAAHLGPTLLPSIHHPLTSLHNFLFVTHTHTHTSSLISDPQSERLFYSVERCMFGAANVVVDISA